MIFNFCINAQIFNRAVELVMPKRAPTNKAKVKLKTDPLTADTKVRKCSN